MFQSADWQIAQTQAGFIEAGMNDLTGFFLPMLDRLNRLAPQLQLVFTSSATTPPAFADQI